MHLSVCRLIQCLAETAARLAGAAGAAGTLSEVRRLLDIINDTIIAYG
jgi:hypothetical protein